MKILMITSYYLPYLAGAELYVKEIAERLVRDGNKVAVLTKKITKIKKQETINGVKVYRVNSGNISHLRSVISFPVMLFKAIRMAKEADVIHSHITYPNGIIAYIVKKITGKEYIVTLQGDELMDYPEKKMLRFMKYPISLALRNAKKVHCISNALAEACVKDFGVDKKKIELIANGVDLSLFGNAKPNKLGNERIILTVSRLSAKNNIEKLIEAMKYVKDAKLIVIGDGPEKYNLMKLKQKTNVEFLGEISHDRLPGYMKAADVFVRTPRTEGLGIVYLEAMASDVPIVASNVGGIKDIIKPGYNGLIASNKDAKEIANAINLLLKDRKLAKKLAKNGRDFVKNYDWEIIYEKTKKMY